MMNTLGKQMTRKYDQHKKAIYIFIIICLSILTIILFSKFSTEDSYITYRYAKNIVDGKGFVYNQGEPFLGTTTPFYALLLSLFGVLGFDIPSIGGILSGLSLALALLLLYLLTSKKGFPAVGLLCGLFILMNPWFLQTFGSETYFQLLMVVAAFYFYDQKKYIPTTVFCALAFLVRADGIILVGIIFADYLFRNKKFPAKEAALFIIICAPFFLFYKLNFGTFIPSTLEAKQAQFASGLWYKFVPGFRHFAGVILQQNKLFYFFIPLLIFGGLALIMSQRIWLLMTSWAVLHTLGYTFLKVSFYHWYLIPLIFLLMLLSGFSLHLLISGPLFFKDTKIKKWNIKILNQEIKISMAKFKDVDRLLKWIYQTVAFVIIGSLIISLYGSLNAFRKSYKSFPFPKLELYTKVGKWIAENTPPQASIAALEVGYLGYHSERRVIDLVGLITPGVAKHVRNRDLHWAIKKFRPDYFISNSEFNGWLNPIFGHPWFDESYERIKEISQPGYPFHVDVFEKVADVLPPQILEVDSRQDESNFAIGEIIQGTEIGQTFTCDNNNLTRIDVMLATYKRKNHQDIIFRLKYSPDDAVAIHTEKFSAADVVDNAYRSFEFPLIPDSNGKMFYFSFESPQSSPGDAITVWANKKNHYKQGSVYINRKKSSGDLRFVTYFIED